jgi:GntR family transcriptional regulator of arabinose operon
MFPNVHWLCIARRDRSGLKMMQSLQGPAETSPKYKKVADELRVRVTSAAYAKGDKLPADLALSREFDTSRLTIIRALRQLETEGLVERRAGSGTYIGVRTRLTAHSLGLLIPDLGEGEIFEPICQGMARAGNTFQQSLVWGNTSTTSHSKEERAIDLCSFFIAQRVSGVFFAPLELTPHSEEINERIVAQLNEANIPIVFLDRSTRPFPEPTQHDLVGIDNWREGFRMAKYLLDLGCRSLGFVLRPGSAPTVEARVAGLNEALRQKGIAMAPLCVLTIDPTDKSTVRQWLRALSPDGILCANDYTAGQLMHTLISLGVNLPKEIRIVGFDDVKYAGLLPVPLTTLRQPCLEIGIAAMKTMLARLEDPTMVPRTISLDCKLVVRESCGAKHS